MSSESWSIHIEIRFAMSKKKEFYARLPFSDLISREGRLFACLLVCGYAANRAYQIAYPTKADANSAAALASRKLGSWEIQAVLQNFKRLYDADAVAFPEHLLKN